jgi:hypothetical protein
MNDYNKIKTDYFNPEYKEYIHQVKINKTANYDGDIRQILINQKNLGDDLLSIDIIYGNQVISLVREYDTKAFQKDNHNDIVFKTLTDGYNIYENGSYDDLVDLLELQRGVLPLKSAKDDENIRIFFVATEPEWKIPDIWVGLV